MNTLYSIEVQEERDHLYQVKYVHHTLISLVFLHTNYLCRNLIKGSTAYFLSNNMCRSGTLGFSDIATKISSRCSVFLTIYLKVKLIIPADELCPRIILPFITIHYNDILIPLFTFCTIVPFLVKVKDIGKRGR